MTKDWSLQHPVITEIERTGYPAQFLDREEYADPNYCAWCGADFQPGEHTYTMCGEQVCCFCFEDWVSEKTLNEIADEMNIHHRQYA